MPCKFTYPGGEFNATNMLDAKPLEFSIELFNWQCKLGFEGEWTHENYEGKYLLWVNDTLANALPEAPPV